MLVKLYLTRKVTDLGYGASWIICVSTVNFFRGAVGKSFGNALRCFTYKSVKAVFVSFICAVSSMLFLYSGLHSDSPSSS